MYSEKVTDFEVQLASEIQIEQKFNQGVKLYRDKRSMDIKIYSSSDFSIE